MSNIFASQTVHIQGTHVTMISIQVQVARGLPNFKIVGLADMTVAESKTRIAKAISFALPPTSSITVNLSPADVKKTGSHYDLAIAICLLVAVGYLPELALEYIGFGELSLNGEILPCKGAMIAALHAAGQGKTLLCADCAGVSIMREHVYIVKHIDDLADFFNKGKSLPRPAELTRSAEQSSTILDLNQVAGQYAAKLGLTIACAGGHNILLKGAMGAGKSMLASRIMTLLPDLTSEQILETSSIYSAAGIDKIVLTPPFRAPHASCSMAGLVGGAGTVGEVSLAHNGVLFLDEMAEFNRNVLQSLRDIMENHQVHIVRSALKMTYPAKFMTVSTMNNCKCGMDPCIGGQTCASAYMQKISGPLLDRFDICVQVNRIDITREQDYGQSSQSIRESVVVARRRQLLRQGCLNSDLKSVKLPQELLQINQALVQKLHISARSVIKALKVARTIADLAQRDEITHQDLLQAYSMRIRFDA